MSKFCSLFSSSSGNSACLSCGDTTILFDCGKYAKTVLTSLQHCGVPSESVRAVCVTHEHSDHISALRVLVDKLGCAVYAPPPLAQYLDENVAFKRPGCVHALDPCGVNIGSVHIRPFRTPHDSLYSVGYQVHTADDRTIGIATDLGHITEEVTAHLLGCDLVMLESNYDRNLLRVSSYPAMLRRRIAGANGHLCNDDCAGFLPKLVESGTTRLLLAHLSRENNTYELAESAALQALNRAGMTYGKDYRLEIARRDEPGFLFVL